MIQAISKELHLRKHECTGKVIETIYFGGGTPSLLTNEELQHILVTVYTDYNVIENPEITLEANPDDLSIDRIHALAKTPVNRLSIGIQSFFDEDLKLMNRAHNSHEARDCLREASKLFENITIDLIYGIPGMDNERWKQNIEIALSYNIPHISSYALTVEPKTALEHFIKKGVIADVDDDSAREQFHILIDTLKSHDFVHYELSNFGKEGFFSKNNSAYWLGKPYIGIGPSAHSFNGTERSWNIRNNAKYIKAIQDERLPSDREVLSLQDQYNEYIMTGLRTIWGVSIKRIESDFGIEFKNHLLTCSEVFIKQHLLYIENQILSVTKEGKFLSDGIAAELFMIN